MYTMSQEIRPSDIRTTYNGRGLQSAEITLPDGRVYSIGGDRYRTGLRGNRHYAWQYHLRGPGIAHFATDHERVRGTKWDRPGGSEFFYLDSIEARVSNLTDAKRRLAALLNRGAA